MHVSEADRLLPSGMLHVYVALDWGEEIDLERANQLAAGSFLALARRSRTPASVNYHPMPVQFQLAPVPLVFEELGLVEARADATVFDFGAVSVALHIPFQLDMAATHRLAGSLSEADLLVQAARTAVGPLHQQLLPSIQQPLWSELSEEYFVFQFPPAPGLPPAETLLGDHADWVAALVRLEDEPLSASEIAEALRLRISYTPDDLFVPEWSAALLIDRECEETLQTIAVANLQLLEYRHLDDRLDERLARAYKVIHPLARTWLPFWRSQGRQLRDLGELRIEAHDVFERTGNVLKLVGDPYLARVYHLLSTRFHLDEWQANIGRALAVAESAYQVISAQATTYRTEALEAIIIILICFEIVMALVH
jgi:hypothetical protein